MESCKLLDVQEQRLLASLTEWSSNTQDQINEVSGTDNTRKIWAVITRVSESDAHAKCSSSRATTLGQSNGWDLSKKAHRAAFLQVVQSDRMKFSGCPLALFGTGLGPLSVLAS